MSIRLVGQPISMGPVTVDTTATIVRGYVVQVASGLVTAVADGDNSGLALAMDKFPDSFYEGTKATVNLVRLGREVEVEIPFTHTQTTSTDVLGAADIGGGPFRLLATNGGTIELASTTNGVFTPLRLGRDTKLGDATGYLIGVFSDASAFGGA